jgi:NAD(P)-dependent dehydrogenase (short-subunit alcohol dehydrogenase family)
MDLGLRDRVYLVTGGSKGLGFATASALVDEGARVVITGRTEETVAASAAELDAVGVACDNADPATPGRLLAAAREAYGRVDGLLVSVGGPPPGGPSAAGAGAGAAPPPLAFVDPSELPDYRPPFLANSARADAQGNVWIRTTATPTAPGALVYDVVSAKGELVDRVQVPAGRQIMGFGRDGSVFLMAREGTGPTATTTLERAKIR